jgi:hypothetical protein
MTTPSADHQPPSDRPGHGTPSGDRRTSSSRADLTASLTAVLVPFEVGHQPRIPVGRRMPIPQVPPALRRPATVTHRSTSGTRRRVLLTAALIAVAVLALAAITVIRATSGPGPRDVVASFFTALTTRDPTGLPAGPCRDNPLCDADALHAGYQAPQDVTIGDATGTGNQRHVEVSYTVAGQRNTTTVDVLGTSTGMFSSRFWSITTPPGAHLIIPDRTPAPITIAAVRLPTPQPGQQATVWAPPGQYTLSRAETTLLEAAQTSITVTSGPPLTIAMPTTIRPAVTETARQLVHARLDACAAKRSFDPAVGPPPTWHSCPMSYDERYTITTGPAWSIDTYPQLHLQPADDGTIIVATTQPGQATIRFQWTDKLAEPRTWTTVTDTVDITVTGRISTANGELAWQPA